MRIQKSQAATVVALLAVNPVAFAQEDSETHHQIDEVVVTATPLKRTVEQLAQPTSILRGEELALKQSTSIGETVSQEVGVTSSFFGPVSSRPIIRGQFGERVRVLSNGLDSLDASALSEDHQTTVDSLLADRIEIIRGPATLLYGSGAAGGIVNVVDRRIAESLMEKPFAASVAASGESATSKGDIAALGQIAAGNFVFSADYFYRTTDDYDIPGSAESEILHALEEAEGGGAEEEEEEEAFGTVENTDSETDSGALSASYISDNGYIGITASFFNSDYGIPGHGHEEEDPGMMPPVEEEEEVVRIDLEQTRFDLRGEYDFGESFISGLRFRAAANDYEHVELEGDEIGTMFENQGFDGRVELRHARIGELEGAFGVQYESIDFDAIGDEAFVPASETTRFSLFLFEELAINSNWLLQASARVERQEITGSTLPLSYDDDAFGASIGTVWRPVDELRVSANLSISERHPNSTELYADGPHIAAQRYERGSVSLGNGILNKERSRNIDVSLHGDSGRFEWTLTGFVNTVNDYILLRPTADIVDEFQAFNFEQTDAEFIGVEAEGVVEVIDNGDSHFHIRATADFVDAEERRSGANLPRIPPKRFTLGLHGGLGQFDAGLDATFASDQNTVAENELRTEGYVLLNANLSYSFDDTGVYLFLRGTNLLDEDIRQHTSPLKDLAPLPGRALHAGVRFDF